MTRTRSDTALRFDLPEDLHARLLNLGYREIDLRNFPLLQGYRLYTSERAGVYYFAAVHPARQPFPLLAMGPYFHRRADMDKAANVRLERESLSVVINDLQRIAWKRSHPSRWQQIMLRHKFAFTVAVVAAILSAAVVCLDTMSAKLDLFGSVEALMARTTDSDATDIRGLMVATRIAFVLLATTVAYWVAFLIDAWRRPIKSVELSKKSLLYQYGPEACRVLNELERKTGAADAVSHLPKEPAALDRTDQAAGYGYGNFVGYAEIENRFQLESKRAHRFAQPLSCLIMTVEPLPGQPQPIVNDIEAYLRHECPRIVWHTIRDIDSFAQYGENGFIMLLPGTDANGAATVAKRLKTDMATCDVGGRAITEIATVRSGLASVQGGTRAEGKELIRRAESALFAQHTRPPGQDEPASESPAR